MQWESPVLGEHSVHRQGAQSVFYGWSVPLEDTGLTLHLSLWQHSQDH